MNIPRLQTTCSFSRKEIYGFYTKFKALAKISKLKNPDQKEIGVTREVFMNGMK